METLDSFVAKLASALEASLGEGGYVERAVSLAHCRTQRAGGGGGGRAVW